jgi:nucleotidyltransferase/DNA polymerase involved in DNA repair
VVPRILCARFPHLGLLAAWRGHPELRPEPVVVGGAPELRLPVIAASPAAEVAGVRAGQPLRQAQQLCPAAVFVALDEDEVERLRAATIAALCAVAPAVELGDEEAFADLSGSHAQHTTEPAWAAAAARALAAALDGEPPAVGVAGSRFVARMAARVSAPRHVRRVRPGEEAAFLAPLPLRLLPADPAVLGRLAALGLDCIGAVASLAPADLQRQFGPDGMAVHRLARGADGGGLHAWAPPRTVAERLALDGAVADLESLRFCARRLADALGARLHQAGLAAATLDLALDQEGGGSAVATRVLPAPAGNAAELWPAVLGLLGEACPSAPVVALRLEVRGLGAGSGRQVDLWRTGDAGRDTVVRSVARLQDRFGAGAVLRPRLAVDPGDLPERRFTWGDGQPGSTRSAAVGGRRGGA